MAFEMSGQMAPRNPHFHRKIGFTEQIEHWYNKPLFMKTLLKKHWPLIGLGALLVLVSFYLIRSGKEIVRGPMVRNIISGEGLSLKDIHYTQDDPDRGFKWVLDAKEVKFSEDRSNITFIEFRLKVEPENRPSFKLKGKRGDYSRDSGEINLWGELEGLSENGYRITTEYMLINEKKGQLRTDKPVKISGPFFTVTGRGLFVDMEKEKLKIFSDVTTIIDKESML